MLDDLPARRVLQLSSLDRTSAWTRSCLACSDRKGLIQEGVNQAVLAMWSVTFN